MSDTNAMESTAVAEVNTSVSSTIDTMTQISAVATDPDEQSTTTASGSPGFPRVRDAAHTWGEDDFNFFVDRLRPLVSRDLRTGS
jgi:hypothetical protein